MLSLSNLTSSGKDRRRRRGRGGSRGGTSGKGGKGQTARSGPKIGAYFEGGQMPLSRRLPKRGFNTARFKPVTRIVNIGQLEAQFENGAQVDKDALLEKGIIKGGASCCVKVLGKGVLSKKLTVIADAFSASAVTAIEALGGRVKRVEES
jgi:large subunit ribosomal protein L15